MGFACKAVDLNFVKTASIRFVNKVELAASPERVFKALEAEDSWSRWFKTIKSVKWSSPEPHGIGSTRTLAFKGMTAYEKFIVWEPGIRFTFYLTSMSAPFASAFCEDFQLEPSDGGKTNLTYTVACEPGLILKLTGHVGRWLFGFMLRDGVRAMAEEMKK
jgi:uncharacterized protein YndB with AHSA1/START domain